MMHRKLYPTSRRDRTSVWVGLVCLVAAIHATIHSRWWWAVGLGLLTLFDLSLVYIFQDQPAGAGSDKYALVIDQIKGIESQLSAISEFLNRERTQVTETEGIVQKLKDEKATLEPIVSTQRQVVEAILAAHSRRTASNIWKERVMGFVSGILASLIAGYVYNLFKK